jgi:hypothetical protein
MKPTHHTPPGQPASNFPPVLNLEGEDRDGKYKIRAVGVPQTHQEQKNWWDRPEIKCEGA